MQLAEAKEKEEKDVAMAIRHYKRTFTFRRESDSNYLTRLNECRAAIMRAHPEINFDFIVEAT